MNEEIPTEAMIPVFIALFWFGLFLVAIFGVIIEDIFNDKED